jgi:hypothetical protein
MKPVHPLKVLAQEALRWYLRRFPLKDGKAFLYKRLHGKLTPRISPFFGPRCLRVHRGLGFASFYDNFKIPI